MNCPQLPDSRYLVLVRASPQEAEQYEADAKAARISAIHDAAGFAAVFDLMRRSGKPAVGHNCMFDIAYGLYSFADAYQPATWRDYRKMVNAWHLGGVYDTKYIAKQLDEVRVAKYHDTMSCCSGSLLRRRRVSHISQCV